MLAEAFVVGVYLIFLLLELRRFPRRIRAGFEPGAGRGDPRGHRPDQRGDDPLSPGEDRGEPGDGASPRRIVLWAFGVPYPLMWGVLTFVGNFIPYVGSLVAFAFPVLLALPRPRAGLAGPVRWRSLLVLIQVVTNNFVEPTLTGQAVDLSPLVTLLCAGLLGPVLGPDRDAAGGPARRRCSRSSGRTRPHPPPRRPDGRGRRRA